MTRTTLSQRTIFAYNRFSKELAALNFIGRDKPKGPVGPATVSACNQLIALANRLFTPELDMPRFRPIDPVQPMSQDELALLTARLTVTALNFEERYRHLSEDSLARQIGRSGFPTPHRH